MAFGSPLSSKLDELRCKGAKVKYCLQESSTTSEIECTPDQCQTVTISLDVPLNVNFDQCYQYIDCLNEIELGLCEKITFTYSESYYYSDTRTMFNQYVQFTLPKCLVNTCKEVVENAHFSELCTPVVSVSTNGNSVTATIQGFKCQSYSEYPPICVPTPVYKFTQRDFYKYLCKAIQVPTACKVKVHITLKACFTSECQPYLEVLSYSSELICNFSSDFNALCRYAYSSE